MAPDLVVTSPGTFNWTSLTFIIPQNLGIVSWKFCGRFSNVYCLSSYEIGEISENPAASMSRNHQDVNIASEYYVWLERNIREQCEVLFRPIYARHNFIGTI